MTQSDYALNQAARWASARPYRAQSPRQALLYLAPKRRNKECCGHVNGRPAYLAPGEQLRGFKSEVLCHHRYYYQ